MGTAGQDTEMKWPMKSLMLMLYSWFLVVVAAWCLVKFMSLFVSSMHGIPSMRRSRGAWL